MDPKDIENPIAYEDFKHQAAEERNKIYKEKLNELMNTIEIKEKMCLGFSHGLKSKVKKEYYSGRKDALTDIKNEIKRLFGNV